MRELGWGILIAALSILLVLPILGQIMLTRKVDNVTGPTWRGITIGESTDKEAIAILGPPDKVGRESDGTLVYHYQVEWPAPLGRVDAYRLVIRRGIVDSIVDNLWFYRPNPRVRLLSYVEQYGYPNYVAWYSRWFGHRIVAFINAGILLNTTGEVYEKSIVVSAYYYRPCPLECVKSRFAYLIDEHGPSSNSDIITTKDPWGFTEEPCVILPYSGEKECYPCPQGAPFCPGE